MPGPEAGYPDQPGRPSLYPQTEDDANRMLADLMGMFTAADSERKPQEERWRREHRLYRSFVDRSMAASWRSAMFIPYAFSIIENIVPRMVSQLPRFTCTPVGPEDVLPASSMEVKLNHSAQRTRLHLVLILGIKTALKFGTGIIKNYYAQEIAKAYEQVPQMQDVPVQIPATDPATGEPIMDINGNPQITTETVQEPVMGPDGQPVMMLQPYEYETYSGPKSVWVDIFDFWPNPEATCIEDARYVIQRTRKQRKDLEELFMQGIYRLPPGMSDIGELWTSEDEDGQQIRKWETDEGTSSNEGADPTAQPCEILEFWLDDNTLATVANRKAVIRVQESPYFHGTMPFVRFVDYLLEGEFWGTGEIEAIEGLQDLANALYNQRIDNSRLVMDSMFAINTKAVEDERDFVMRPGGLLRITGDYLPEEAFSRIDLGDVTGSAFEEAANVERLIERISGVSPYQLGTGDEGYNSTATGASLITEAGNTKIALKVKQMELQALQPLAEQWGSIVQQYTDQDEFIRLLGPNGMWLFGSLSPEALQGGLDYTIETMSTTQSETVMKEQAITLLQSISGVMPQAVPQLVKDVLDAFGKKDLVPYFTGMPDLMAMQQLQMAQQMGGQVIPFPQLFQSQEQQQKAQQQGGPPGAGPPGAGPPGAAAGGEGY